MIDIPTKHFTESWDCPGCGEEVPPGRYHVCAEAKNEKCIEARIADALERLATVAEYWRQAQP